MSVSRRVIHHGLYFAVLGPLIGVLFLVLYIFFAKEPLVLLVIIQVLPLFLLLSITTGAIPALLTGVMVACLPEKIGSQKNYRCLAGGIGGVVITEIYCAVIVHIKGMASSELWPMGRVVRLFLKVCSKPRNFRMPWLTLGWNRRPPL